MIHFLNVSQYMDGSTFISFVEHQFGRGEFFGAVYLQIIYRIWFKWYKNLCKATETTWGTNYIRACANIHIIKSVIPL